VGAEKRRSGRISTAAELHASRVVSPEPSVLEAIAEESARLEPRSLALASGRRISAEPTAEGDRIRIESPDGEVELTVTMTANGPVLRFRAADVSLAASGRVEVDCERFEVRARAGISHDSGGDLREVVAGDKLTKVRGTHAALARRTLIESKRGDVRLVANDDVEIVGERVKLNC